MDVAVLGGGPAGLAAAIALRQRGCRVAVYDGQRPPIDKACGEGLMPEAVRLLGALGVVLDEQDGGLLSGISFHDSSASAYAAFSGGGGLAVRRTHLQARMAGRAATMGIALHWGAVVRAMNGGFASASTPIEADFYVVADGLCSTLAAASGFRERASSRTRYASRQQFQCAPWSDQVEVHWRDHEQLYITPLGADEVGVTLLTAAPGRKLNDALPDFPVVRKRLANASPTSAMRGAVTRTRHLREVVRANIAVLGDASGSVDAVTGEGLLSALQQANALADAIVAGEPHRYATAHRQIARRPGRMAQLLLLLDRYPRLQRGFVRAMATRPETFAGLLRVHLCEQSWPGLAWSETAVLLVAGQRTIRNSARDICSWLRYAAGFDRERGL